VDNQVIRLVTWNIEKGKRWTLLEKCLAHPTIRSADILCLNEVDEGMARSGNLSIAHEIGNRLELQVVFGQTFKELTKGTAEELAAPGENTRALQGNAILTRLPILDSANLLLPSCFDHSKRVEKREGNRHALIVRVQAGLDDRSLVVANAHLEVFGTARCRNRQMKFLLEHLPAGPAIVTGDFNTNTFNRGSAFHAFQSLAHLVRRDVVLRTLNPALHESIFETLASAGFSWRGLNDTLPTCSVDLSTLDDRRYVPAPVRKFILRRISVLPLRLDFICCRGLRPHTSGRTITDLPCQPSDHLPITCDLEISTAPAILC
jgi:endonuclease/exonuclease/phosphatase family metal-dependent hydrolase